jgi:hypothetical protein
MSVDLEAKGFDHAGDAGVRGGDQDQFGDPSITKIFPDPAEQFGIGCVWANRLGDECQQLVLGVLESLQLEPFDPGDLVLADFTELRNFDVL